MEEAFVFQHAQEIQNLRRIIFTVWKTESLMLIAVALRVLAFDHGVANMEMG